MVRVYWIDILRTLAAILVFISHYAYNYNFDRLAFFYNNVAGFTGRIGVVLFFFVSGYLAAMSLKSGLFNLKRFYLVKSIRILVPYWISYFVVSSIFILGALFNPNLVHNTPLARILYVGGDYFKLIPMFLGIDGISNALFETDYYFFVGEWFIGAIICMYIIAPILVRIAINSPIYGTLFVILSSVLVFYLWPYKNPFWVFLSRMPEFYLGILFFYYSKLFDSNKTLIMSVCFSIVIGLGCIYSYIYTFPFIADRYFPLEPQSFAMTVPLTILLVGCAKFVDCKYDVTRIISKFSKVSYAFMLLQHVVIITYLPTLNVQQFSKFGIIYILLLLIVATYFFARLVFYFY